MIMLEIDTFDLNTLGYALTNNFVFSYFLQLGEVFGQYLSQVYIATLPHMQSEMG